MQENLTSPDTLQADNPAKPAECVRSEKKGSFGDTVILQTILCVVLAIGFVVVNILDNNLAADIFDAYKSKFVSDKNIFDIAFAIADYLGTAPINHV